MQRASDPSTGLGTRKKTWWFIGRMNARKSQGSKNQEVI